MTRVVRAVSIGPDTIEVAYLDDTTDIRGDSGSVYQVHTVVVARTDTELEDEVEDLETVVATFVDAAVRRWAMSLPVDPAEALRNQMDRVLADPHEMVPTAVEEGMRWISPIGTQTRQVRQEVELAGVRLPVGARVAAVVASANRDERIYEQPDRFVLGRTRRTHAAFGQSAGAFAAAATL